MGIPVTSTCTSSFARSTCHGVTGRDCASHRFFPSREMEEEAFLRQFGIAFSLMNAFALAFLRPIFAIIHGECTAKGAMELVAQSLDAIFDALHQNGVN